MKMSIRIASMFLCVSMLLGLGTALVSAEPGTVTGLGKSETQDIKIGALSTGVTLTQMTLTEGSKYSLGTTGLVNVVEVNLSNSVTMKVLNGGKYNWSTATMGTSVVAYNSTHDDSTVLAAVNGDPWLVYHTDYDGDGEKATGAAVKHVSVSRGMMVIEGELWASHQIDDENNLARTDNAERGTSAARGPVFAIKEDGTAMIGTPRISVKLQNTSKNTNQTAHGVNRLPAPNSIILYNQRCGTESFAYEDAYEIYVECSDSAFSLSEATTGKVTAIFASGDKATRPAITDKTVIISARGRAIDTIKDKYAVGDKVSVTCTVTSDSDAASQKADWANVKEAIGSFFYLLKNGNTAGQPTNSTNYPCSIIGLTKDGKVLMTSTTSTVDGTRSACQMKNLPAMCKELGYQTAILFDGGGSTTMVSLEGDNYVRRSSAVDGTNSVRGVISGIAVVYNGINKEPKNVETLGTVTYEALGLPKVEVPDLPEGVDFVGAPSYSYRYYVKIDAINGNQYDNLIGRRNPATWDAGDKSGSIDPAIVHNVELGQDKKLSLSGYAFVNGGQGDHYWSTDLENWHLCTDGTYSDGDSTMEGTATEGAAMNSTSVTNACFTNVSADLSEYAGQVITVYFGITAKADKSKICSYLSVNGVAVPADETETEPEPESDTDAASGTEAETTAAETTVEAETTVITDTAFVETEAPADGGCFGLIGVSGMLLAAAAAVALRKRED